MNKEWSSFLLSHHHFEDLEKATAAELSQNNSSGLEMESTTPKSETKFRIHIA